MRAIRPGRDYLERLPEKLRSFLLCSDRVNALKRSYLAGVFDKI